MSIGYSSKSVFALVPRASVLTYPNNNTNGGGRFQITALVLAPGACVANAYNTVCTDGGRGYTDRGRLCFNAWLSLQDVRRCGQQA
eukprot:6988119-Pyramimonas_sp.AAC.1